MNPHNYSIVIQRTVDDEGTIFEAHVVEFPDLAVFEESWEEAYAVAIELLEGLIEMAAEMGHEVPLPVDNSSTEYSGKITFRPGRKLHRHIAESAERDGVSLNQWLCFAASSSATADNALAILRDEMKAAVAHLSPTYVQVIGTSAKGLPHGAAVAGHTGAWGDLLGASMDDDSDQNYSFGISAIAGDIAPDYFPLRLKSGATR